MSQENLATGQTKETMEEKTKKPKKGIIIGGVVGLVIALGVIFYAMNAGKEETDNAQLDANIVPIRASVAGYIDKVLFKDNEHVKKGQVLIQFDTIDLKTKVAQAEAALENSMANLAASKNTANSASQNAGASALNSIAVEQNIGASKAKMQKAEDDFKRISNMFKAKAATQAQLDAAKADLDVTKAQYDAAVDQFKSSQAQAGGIQSQAEAQHSQIKLAEALVKQREAELVLAKTQLRYGTVVAPCDGIVTKRSVEPGQYLLIGQPLASVVDNENLWITANFKETQMLKMKPGQEVSIKLDAYPGLVLKGNVDSYIGATGAKFSLLPPDNATGNFVKITQRVPVKISLKELPEDFKDKLFPGLSAFVEVKIK